MELAGLTLELGKLIWSPIRDCCKYHRGLNEYMEALKEKLEELQCHKHDIELRLRTECLPGKKAQREVQLWQEKVQRLLLEVQELNVEVGRIKCFSKAFLGKSVLQKIKEVEELLQRSGNLSNKFSLVVDADDGKILPAATLTGDSTAKRKMAEVWECLLSNDVQKIGLYGIGGPGKTTIMKHVYNRLLERTDKFDNVIWVTMSTAFDVIPIQQDIAEELRLDLSNFEEETKRAQELYAAFGGKRRCLLILDDLWEAFPLNRIGIPEPTLANGCKIVLTTRSLEVCRRMDCKDIRMELLTKDEAWELFLNEVGQDVLLRMDLKAIAEQVAKECACLPLAIVAIASSLKGSVDMSDWLNALEELQKSRTHTDMGTQVIEKLKLSYSRLKDKKLQHCLLHCALYPKDEEISRDDLINELMDEDIIIDDSDSRQAQVNKGHAMLNKLENACLLESCESYYGSRCVKMHDLVREMALQIMNATPKAMVEAGLGLKRTPDQEKWFDDLVKVSLINNDIKTIPSNLSPRCPQLSTLWLRENPSLECIPESFFKQLHGLKVLDLSRTGIERLPDSISDLVCLTTLLLGGCHKLKHIPSLVKLRELKKLVINETSLEEAPHGMDQLSTLRYLDIFSRKLELPAGMLPRLSNLELLRMGVGQVQEAAYLSKLQSFECCFHGLTQFNKYLESREESHELSLSEYCFVIVGQDNFVITSLDSPWRYPNLKRSRKAWIRDCNISMANFKALPKDIEKLTIERCFGVRSLSDVSPLQHANQLKTLKIWECAGIESLLSVSSFPLEILQSLRVLWLANLESLCTVIKIEGASLTPLPHEGTFSFLKHFKMSSCPNVKKLFHPCLLPRLQNLEKLEVEFCRMLEEIISVQENEAEEENEITVIIEENNNIASSGQFSLPKLKILRLEGLPNLRSICKGSMVCDSIQKVYVCHCPKLKNIPLSKPLPSLQKIQVYPPEWWESVEWPHYPEAKNDLQSLCLFCY